MVINSETAHCSDTKHGPAWVGLTFQIKSLQAKPSVPITWTNPSELIRAEGRTTISSLSIRDPVYKRRSSKWNKLFLGLNNWTKDM